MTYRENKKQYRKDYRAAHKEEIAAQDHEYYLKNKERIAEYQRNHYLKFNPKDAKRRKEYRDTHREEKSAQWKKRYQTPPGKYIAYKSGARDRGIEFSLTKEEFTEFWQQPCFYCGGEIATIGLDRVDSAKGYEKGNVVPCCTTCNYMKLDHTLDEFIEHCLKVVEYQHREKGKLQVRAVA